MEIELTEGCVCNYLGIDGISEVDMTDAQRQEYFKKICEALPTLDDAWFNVFLQWLCEEYGEYSSTDKPCECCGDIVETYKVKINN